SGDSGACRHVNVHRQRAPHQALQDDCAHASANASRGLGRAPEALEGVADYGARRLPADIRVLNLRRSTEPWEPGMYEHDRPPFMTLGKRQAAVLSDVAVGEVPTSLFVRRVGRAP